MSKIEWTNFTWNPIAGCSDKSPGCKRCYARGLARRLAAMGQKKYEGLTVLQGSHVVWTGKISFDEKALLAPLKRKKPARYFVNSMSDLFHENVTDEMRDRIFAVMALCSQHTFQVLTKRPERMVAYLTERYTEAGGITIADAAATFFKGLSLKDRRVSAHEHARIGGMFEWDGPLPNVWLGVSVESQMYADERIPLLLQTPAALRFISAEPLIGPIDLHSSLGGTRWIGGQRGCDGQHHGKGTSECPRELHHHHDERCRDGLDWAIVGGESGPGARPMHPDWARSLRDQCIAAGVPFFFKQWGEWKAGAQGGSYLSKKFMRIRLSGEPVGQGQLLATDGMMYREGKKKAGCLLDGQQWQQYPEVRA